MRPALQRLVAHTHLRCDLRNHRFVEREGLQLSCRKGCFSCCLAWVVVGSAEAEYLRQHLSPNQLSAVESAGSARLKMLAQNKDQTDFPGQYFLAQHRCPLLDAENACSAHPYRPLACRGVLTNLEAHYCAPGVVPSLGGEAKRAYQRQLTKLHQPEHYLKSPWLTGQSLAQKLWQHEQQARGFVVIGELACQVFLLGQPDYRAALEAGQGDVEKCLNQHRVLGGEWGFWVG